MGDDRDRAWQRPVGAGAFLAAALVGACILPDLDLEGRPCPCAEGYGCDLTTNTCVEGDATSGPTSSSAAGSTSQSTSAASTADVGSSSGGGEGGAGEGGGQGGAGEGGQGGAGTGGYGGQGGAGTGGSGGEGGAPGCPVGQTERVPACGVFVDTFDGGDFPSGYSLTGPAASFSDENSRLTITMSTQTAYLAIPNDIFDMVGCGITVRLLAVPTGANIFARISIAPSGQQSRFSIGVIDGTLQAREGDSVEAATAYDPDVHRYLRIREEGGSLYFGTSADGVCWTEHHDVVSEDTIGLTGRLGLVSSAAALATSVEYDDYNFLP